MEGEQWTGRAVYCIRGHLLSGDEEQSSPPEFCPHCGGNAVARHECGATIPGVVYAQRWFEAVDPGQQDGYLSEPIADTERPSFCFECGEPFPWVDRVGRIYEMENRLLRDPDLEAATKLALRDAIDRLRSADTAEAEVDAWKRIKSIVPDLAKRSGVMCIVRSVATAWILKQAGLS